MTPQDAALTLLGLFAAAALVYALWDLAGEVVAAHVADALDNLTDDGPDDLDRWLAQTPAAPVDDWSAWEREVAT